MKMRKLLPLAILAVGALFLLSSCDAMLDAIFQKDNIDVDVAVQGVPTNVYWDWYYNMNPQVTCYLSDGNGSPISTASAGWSYWDGTYLHFTMTFKNLKDNTYTFSTVYTGYYGLTRQVSWPAAIWDGNYGTGVGGWVPVSSSPRLPMPFGNASDSTGHLMKVILYIP